MIALVTSYLVDYMLPQSQSSTFVNDLNNGMTKKTTDCDYQKNAEYICVLHIYRQYFSSFVYQKTTSNTQVHFILDTLRLLLVPVVWVTLPHLPKLDINKLLLKSDFWASFPAMPKCNLQIAKK